MKNHTSTPIIKLSDTFALGRLVPIAKPSQKKPKRQSSIHITPKFLQIMDTILEEDK